MREAGVVLGAYDSTRLFRQLTAKQGGQALDYNLFLRQLHEKALETYDAKRLSKKHVLPTRTEASAQMQIVRQLRQKDIDKGKLWDRMLAKGSKQEQERGSVSFSQFRDGMHESGVICSEGDMRKRTLSLLATTLHTHDECALNFHDYLLSPADYDSLRQDGWRWRGQSPLQ